MAAARPSPRRRRITRREPTTPDRRGPNPPRDALHWPNVIGETIGHFEIIARAGRGGMGEVFVAEHATIKTRVAIKVLHPHVSANTAHVQRFFNETCGC